MISSLHGLIFLGRESNRLRLFRCRNNTVLLHEGWLHDRNGRLHGVLRRRSHAILLDRPFFVDYRIWFYLRYGVPFLLFLFSFCLFWFAKHKVHAYVPINAPSPRGIEVAVGSVRSRIDLNMK